MSENYTLAELREEYPPRMIDVNQLNKTEGPTLGPLDFVYIDDWEDLSKVGADLHDLKRHQCEDDVNNWLDITFVACTYDGKYMDDEETKLKGSVVAIAPHAMIDADYQTLRNQLVEIVNERGFGMCGSKTIMEEVEDDDE